jgi:hypothetical protein
MNPCSPAMRPIWALLLACAASLPALASPGAHGPNGEHLDGPASTAGGGNAAPQMEAKSEQFELVAKLGGGELSILIDRFETNEPVLNATVEVESGPLKAIAKFHADQGVYAVDDPTLLQALRQPGAHPILITLIAGQESDLLEGTLQVATQVAAGEAGHGHSHGPGAAHADESTDVRRGWRRPALLVTGLAVIGIGGLWLLRRNRRRATLVEMAK